MVVTAVQPSRDVDVAAVADVSRRQPGRHSGASWWPSGQSSARWKGVEGQRGQRETEACVFCFGSLGVVN